MKFLLCRRFNYLDAVLIGMTTNYMAQHGWWWLLMLVPGSMLIVALEARFAK